MKNTNTTPRAYCVSGSDNSQRGCTFGTARVIMAHNEAEAKKVFLSVCPQYCDDVTATEATPQKIDLAKKLNKFIDRTATPLEITTLNKLKKGDYFKTVNAKGEASKTVYVKDDYNKSTRKYIVYKFEDINADKLLKGNTAVTTDFIF